MCSIVVFISSFFAGDELCNVDYNNKYPTGSIMKNTIEELWKSKIMNATYFNENINQWNTSKAKNMSGMFKEATNFNQPLNSWNTYNVTMSAN